MRPERLVIKGFTAFRDEVEIDFRDADAFVLSGPTGSGKSSIIDAICFALYGRVPRYDDKRLVEPVITVGSLEARVRFDFTVGDRRLSATRVARRTKTGATTPEASLEEGDTVLAGSARDVSGRVGELLGLDFDHFTKCVVLPQGDFAAFLHDEPGDRQELMRRLLDLGIYVSIRRKATGIASESKGQVKILEARIAELAGATSDALEASSDRVEALAKARSRISSVVPEQERLRERLSMMETELKDVESARKQLSAVSTPKTIQKLGAKLGEAAADVELTLATSEQAGAGLHKVKQKAESIVEPDRLLRLRKLRIRVEELAEEASTAALNAKQLHGASATTREALDSARGEVETAKHAHVAADLRQTLAIGDACPVCEQTIAVLPEGDPPVALERAAKALDETTRVHDEALAGVRAAELVSAGIDSQLESVRADELALSETFDDAVTALDPKGLDTLIEASTVAHAAVIAAMESVDAASKALDRAHGIKAGLEQSAAKSWRDLDKRRSALATHDPPILEREDLALDWKEFQTWASDLAAAKAIQIGDMDGELKELWEQDKSLSRDVASILDKLDLDPGDAPPLEAIAAATATEEAKRETIKADLAASKVARSELQAVRESGEVSGALAEHLKANRFEGWLMEEAMLALVGGANTLLGDLSSNAYSLAVDGREFSVVDHRNADEQRSVKTLSGGETFLVSLALALTLAEQLASMSVHGAAHLESIFLDEGFGTLDSESLEIVAGVIHELEARGRTVGLVTHVRELADLMPVRFEVTKGSRTATVRRVDS